MRVYVAASCALLVGAPLAGQTVRQGTAQEVPAAANAFQSPMILETIFAPADQSLWVSDEWTPSKPKPWKSGDFTTPEYYALGKFSCDGILLQNGNRHGPWSTGCG